MKPGKKKGMVILTMVCLSLAAGGCGKKEQLNLKGLVTKIQEAKSESEYKHGAEQTALPQEDFQRGVREIDQIKEDGEGGSYGFREGRAWVVDENSDKNLVDTDGNVVYTLPYSSELMIGTDGLHPVQDGVTYIQGETTGAKSYSVCIIIDKDGKELRRLVSNASETYEIIGYGDGAFVVVCTRSDMKASGSYVFSIGTDGKNIQEPKHLENSESDGFHVLGGEASDRIYLGENIFCFPGNANDTFFYNTRNGSIQHSYTKGQCVPLGKFYKGKTLVQWYDKMYTVTAEDFMEDRPMYMPTEEYHGPNVENKRIVAGHYVFKEKLYDLDGNLIYDTKAYENYDIMWPTFTLFEDGYTAFSFTGADQQTYATVLDPQGKELYEPVQSGDQAGGIKYGQEGYIQWYDNGILKFTYPDGSVHSWNDNLKEMKNLTFGAVGNGYLLVGAGETGSEGWERTQEGAYKFISLDQKKQFTCQLTKKTKVCETSSADTQTDIPTDTQTGMQTENKPEIENDQSHTAAMNSLLKDTVLFQENGVTLKILSEEKLELKNENQDNKIAELHIEGIYYNGINPYHDQSNSTWESVQSGETKEINVGENSIEFQNFMAGMSKALAEIPVETITYSFKIRIGTSSEEESYCKKLTLPSYKEEDMAVIYGDKLGEFKPGKIMHGGLNEYQTEYPDVTITAYRIKTDDGIAVLLQNNMDIDIRIPSQIRWMVNGEIQDDGFVFKGHYIPGKSATIYKFGESADSIRRRKELPNDTPINIQMAMHVSTFEVNSKEGEVVIDLGEIN